MNQELDLINAVWALVTDSVSPVAVDVYFVSGGYSGDIHDRYGAHEVEVFRQAVLREVRRRTNACGAGDVWNFLNDGFAVRFDDLNPDGFIVRHRDIEKEIFKKTLILSAQM